MAARRILNFFFPREEPDLQKYFEYYGSMLVGFSHSVDKVTELKYGDHTLVPGEVTKSEHFDIDDIMLMGGPAQNGGVRGRVTIIPGDASDPWPDGFDLAAVGIPADWESQYRHTCMAAFRAPFVETDRGFVSQGPGFYFGANTGQVLGVSAKLTRAPRGLDPAYAMTGEDSNPVHVIYEIMTNQDWGDGRPKATMDTRSFDRAARFAMEYGVSFAWDRSSDPRQLIERLSSIAEVMVFEDLQTGLMKCRALADTAQRETLHLTPEFASFDSVDRSLEFDRPHMATVRHPDDSDDQLINDVTVMYAATPQQTGINARLVLSYDMIRSRQVAQRVGFRELQRANERLVSIQVTIPRSYGANAQPGDRVIVTSPDDGLDGWRCIVVGVSLGDTDAAPVTLTLTNDIYSGTPASLPEPEPPREAIPVASGWGRDFGGSFGR